MREARLHPRPYSKPRPHLAIASAVTPYGGKLAGRYDLGVLCVMAGSPHGYDALDYNWARQHRGAGAGPGDGSVQLPDHGAVPPRRDP
jgi:alkanesulfonate monooxygenase SsuD/methylene tetrahydromethanopterin reductase-like flavin-dependent oxidoreductase (luciferase family)